MQDKKPLLIIGFVIIAVFVLLILVNNSGNSENLSNSNTPQAQNPVQVPAEESKESTMPVQQNSNNKKTYSQPFAMQLKDGVNYKAEMETSMGTIKIDLFEKESPITVNNFVSLAKDGFYDGIIFHRVIEDFMIQGGDPMGVGIGDAGYKFNDEFNDKKLVKGSLAMANSGPNTNGSQFFIVTATETPWLDGKHTNFGQVYEGQDVVDAISKVAKDGSDKPLTPVTITKVTIVEE